MRAITLILNQGDCLTTLYFSKKYYRTEVLFNIAEKLHSIDWGVKRMYLRKHS